MKTSMLRKLFATSATIAALSLPFAAQASDKCGDVPQDQWLSIEQVRAKATELGYDVRKVKVEDGCYDAYAIDKNGNRVEAYFDPATGEIVKTKTDD